MTWAEFRQWAWDAYRYRLRESTAGVDIVRIWGTSRIRTGSGVPAVYTLRHQRRLGMWLRIRDLIDQRALASWLAACESYADGWLVNDGSGIRWVADPAPEWDRLLASGFVAVRCGL